MGIEHINPDKAVIVRAPLPEPWALGIADEHVGCYHCSWAFRAVPFESGRMELKFANAKCPVPGHGDPRWGMA